MRDELEALRLEVRDLRTDLVAQMAESERLRQEAVGDVDTLLEAICRTAHDCDCSAHFGHSIEGGVNALIAIAQEHERGAALRAELAAVAEAMHGPTMQPLAGRVRSYVEAAEKRAATISTLFEWTNTYGAELKPPGADTFGEGMREAKARVRRILTAEGGGG
jgi:hypothetical protein